MYSMQTTALEKIFPDEFPRSISPLVNSHPIFFQNITYRWTVLSCGKQINTIKTDFMANVQEEKRPGATH